MVFEVVTAADGAEVLRRAKTFFAERIPMYAAFPRRKAPPGSLRGQGGEEIAFAVAPAPGGTRSGPARCCSISRWTASFRPSLRAGWCRVTELPA